MRRSPGVATDSPSIDLGVVAGAQSKIVSGNPRDRRIGRSENTPVGLVARVAPFVLALEAEAKALADAAQRRQDRLPERRRAGDDRDRRLHRQLDVVVGREGVDQHAELEARLDKGLHPHAGRP